DRQTAARTFRALEDHPLDHLLGRRTAPGQWRQVRDDESLGGRDRTAPGHAVYLPGEPQGQGRGRLARLSPRGVLRRLSWRRALPRVAGRRGPADTRLRGCETPPPGSPRVGPETTSSETRVTLRQGASSVTVRTLTAPPRNLTVAAFRDDRFPASQRGRKNCRPAARNGASSAEPAEQERQGRKRTSLRVVFCFFSKIARLHGRWRRTQQARRFVSG